MKFKSILEELEFNSLLKKYDLMGEVSDNTVVDDKLSYKDIKEFDKNREFAFYIETRGEVYSKSEIIGISLFDGENCYFIDLDNLEKYKDIFECDTKKITYDLKKNIVVLNNYNIELLLLLNQNSIK